MDRTINKHRRQLDPVKTRTEILEAAIGLYAERGYSGASIAHIATAAGVPKSLVQYHFGTKEELWQACLMHRAEPMLQVVDRVLAGELAPIELVKARIAIHSQHPEMGRLLAWMSLEPLPMPAFLTDRRKGLLQLAAKGQVGDHTLGFLLALATVDGWFFYRSLYLRLIGEDVAASLTPEELLHRIEKMLASPSDQPTL
jgi:AcrR family transcriptional regulator